ncbi:MAG: UbiA family prenyltransferase [Prolixibacteraceae bacterium]
MAKIPVISLFDRDTVKHLRFPFSFFLLPVFLFALSQTATINWPAAILACLVLHLFIFPSSNGYNSYQDRDESSIGGLKYPPKISENLYYVTLYLDLAGILLALAVSPFFALEVLIFIVMSRLYSYRKIRLKKYPVAGFLIVFIFQGAFVYLMALTSFILFPDANLFSANHLMGMAVASLFIGSIYPLTQIYQHEADKKDGVTSLSYQLGYKGTFLFSGILFASGMLLLFLMFSIKKQYLAAILFIMSVLPVVILLIRWFGLVMKNIAHANYENTMMFNRVSSWCMNVYFSILILNNYLDFL